MTQDELRAHALKLVMGGAPKPAPVNESAATPAAEGTKPVSDKPLLAQALDNRLNNIREDDSAKAEARKKLIESTDPGLTAKLLGSLMR